MGRLANIAKCPEIDGLKHSVQGMMKTREQTMAVGSIYRFKTPTDPGRTPSIGPRNTIATREYWAEPLPWYKGRMG